MLLLTLYIFQLSMYLSASRYLFISCISKLPYFTFPLAQQHASVAWHHVATPRHIHYIGTVHQALCSNPRFGFFSRFELMACFYNANQSPVVIKDRSLNELQKDVIALFMCLRTITFRVHICVCNGILWKNILFDNITINGVVIACVSFISFPLFAGHRVLRL